MEKPFHKKTLDEVAKEEGFDKPPKVTQLNPEDSVPTLHEPKPGDLEKAIEELERIPGKSPDKEIPEIPEKHQVPLDEARRKLVGEDA